MHRNTLIIKQAPICWFSLIFTLFLRRHLQYLHVDSTHFYTLEKRMKKTTTAIVDSFPHAPDVHFLCVYNRIDMAHSANVCLVMQNDVRTADSFPARSAI